MLRWVEDSGRQEVYVRSNRGGADDCGDIVRENEPSWDFIDNSDPVITAAAATERHEGNLIQRQRNLVGGDVVLDVVRDALAECLDGEAE